MTTEIARNFQSQPGWRWIQSKWILFTILTLGLFLRLVPYSANRSLWIDEAFVSLNILNRSWAELVQPLDYDQAAPIGFLFVQKAIVLFFGNSEYALRLFPLLAGITALVLFHELARRCVLPNTALLALTLFALLNSLIYYSSEAKQYSSDVLLAVLLLLLAQNHIQSSEENWQSLVWLGLAGAMAVWFSHPSVFVLAGIGTTLGMYYLVLRAYRQFAVLLLACGLWVLNFAVGYAISLRYLAGNTTLDTLWQFALAPLPFQPVETLRWLATVLMGIFVETLNLPLPGLALFCLVIGVGALFLHRRWMLMLLLSPLTFTLLAAVLHKYPFSGRLLLFSVPMLLLILAYGAEQIYEAIRERSKFIGILLIALIVISALGKAMVHLQLPLAREEIKPVLAYYRDHFQEGDTLYVYYWAQFTLKYYQAAYGVNDYTLGVRWNENSWSLVVEDLKKLLGKKRVWVLFTQAYRGNEEEPEEKFVRFNLDQLGTRVSSYRVTGASIYLYDLSQ